MNRLLPSLCLSLFICQAANGREIVHLTSGFSIEADSHSVETDLVILKVGAGTMQLAKADIREILWLPDAVAAAAGTAENDVTASPEHLLRMAALSQGLPDAFVRSVASIESGLRQTAISPKGAIGLMQLMPGTALALKVDPRIPGSNALGGAAYLRQLLLKYAGDSGLALAAYNAGPGAVQKFGGVPPYAETRQYIARVLAEYKRQQNLAKLALSTAAPSANKVLQ